MPQWTSIEDITSPRSISTSTHLVLARSFYTRAAGWSTFIQAFALSHLNPHRDFTPLSPSHQGIIPGINVRDTVLLHDSVLDASTQDVLITIRVEAFEPSRPRSSLLRYGMLRLGGTTRGTSSSSHDKLGTVALRLLGSFGPVSQVPFLHPSSNGAGRAFYMSSYGIVSVFEYDVHGGGGGEDDEREAKVIDYNSILRYQTPRTLLDYDPYSGRICLRSAMAKYSVIEIWDLAV